MPCARRCASATPHPVGFGGDSESSAPDRGRRARGGRLRLRGGARYVGLPRFRGAERLLGGPASYLDAFLVRRAAAARAARRVRAACRVLGGRGGRRAAHCLWSALCNRAAGALVRRSRYASIIVRRTSSIPSRRPWACSMDGSPSLRSRARAFAESFPRSISRPYALPAERAAVLVPAERFEPLPSLAGL